ncbi:MAG: DUF2878 domain-containing protein [Luminiphilus sp.]|nr:DUF2878 domain-containing protein [Luminiphilus sp.]
MTTLSPLLIRLRALNLTEKTWFNAVWFQSTWFLCVLGQDALLPFTLGMLALHFILVNSAREEARRLLPVFAVGIGVDTLLSAIGIFDFGPTLIPLWLMALWVAFAASLTRALGVFGRSSWLAALVGGIGVPFNYAVGAKMGAVTLPMDPILTGGVLIVIWAMLLPALYQVAKPTPRLKQA